jgi:hypothetical protein
VPRGRAFSARAVTVDFDLTGGWFQGRARSSGISAAKPDFDEAKADEKRFATHHRFFPAREKPKTRVRPRRRLFCIRTPYVAHASYNNSGVSHA